MNKKLIEKIVQSSVWLVLLTIAIAYFSSILIYKLPTNFESEGDLGRDLYIFYLSSLGKLPYVDYNWIYGPFVPILYGLYYKISGISILNTLTLWYLTFFICIYLVYYQVRLFSSAFFGFLAGVVFLLFHNFFAHTFNHIFGLPFLLLIVIFIYKYLDNNRPLYIYLAAVNFIFLALVKLNIAIAVVIPFYLIIIAINYHNKKDLKHIIGSFGLFLLVTIALYGLLIINSPLDQIAKSFPYSSKYIMKPLIDLQSNLVFSAYSDEISERIIKLPLSFLFTLSTINLWYFLLPLAGFLAGYFIYKKEGTDSKNFVFILILAAIILTNTHEFIVAGRTYSLIYWVLAVWIILLFFIVDYIKNNWFNRFAIKVILVIFTVLFLNAMIVRLDTFAEYKKYPAICLPTKRAQVYFINIPWLLTVHQCLQYIEKNSKKDEKVLTLPYNSIYNYLSEREQPGRYIEFLYLSGLNDSDQYKVIDEIEKNKVKLILYAQKISSVAGGIGIFGVTHCKILDKYIKKNYFHSVTLRYQTDDTSIIHNSFYKRKTPFRSIVK